MNRGIGPLTEVREITMELVDYGVKTNKKIILF